jgi:hypothetical protein
MKGKGSVSVQTVQKQDVGLSAFQKDLIIFFHSFEPLIIS